MSRPSLQQLEALVEFLAQNPSIAKGILRTTQAKQENKIKWQEVSTSLNALGNAQKDGKAWAKYWADKKCAIKKQCAHYAEAKQLFGSSESLPLTTIDLKLLATVGGPEFFIKDSQVDGIPIYAPTGATPCQILKQRRSSLQSDCTDPTPSTSHSLTHLYESPQTLTKHHTDKHIHKTHEKDQYDIFAKMVAGRIRNIKDLKQRLECMNTIRDVVSKFLLNNKAVLPDQNEFFPDGNSNTHRNQGTIPLGTFVEVQDPLSQKMVNYVNESENRRISSKNVNNYFDLDVDIRCVICRETLDDGERPTSHLQEYHPEVFNEIIKNEEPDSDAESTKSEEPEMTCDISYLPSKKRKAETQLEIETKKLKTSPTRDNYGSKATDIGVPQNSKPNDQIDPFLNYIKVILDKMPPDMCTKVQFSILNVIMTAQMGTSTSNVTFLNSNFSSGPNATVQVH